MPNVADRSFFRCTDLGTFGSREWLRLCLRTLLLLVLIWVLLTLALLSLIMQPKR